MNNLIEGREDEAEDGRSSNFMRLFGQMMMLPFTVFVQGMELFIKTIQGIQRATDEGMNVMVGETTPALTSKTTRSVTDSAIKGGAETSHKEATKMDQDLSGEDTLKLVRYKILFVKRDYEVPFDEQEDLVSYATTGTDWGALQIANFMGSLGRIRRPRKWHDKHYPPGVSGDFIHEIPDGDRKYIRIYFEVLQRWERQEAEYEKQQVEVLRDIRDRMGP